MPPWTAALMLIMTEKHFQVLWTETAQQDLKQILQYFAAKKAQAKKTYSVIKEKAKSLWAMPFRGRIVPELYSLGITTYRELICPPWRIIYKIDSDRIWVLAVIDGRRNMEDILLERFLAE